MSNKNKKTVSQEVIDKIGLDNLRRLTLRDEAKNTELEVIGCVPNRVVTGEFLKFNQSNPKKAQEVLVKNCILTDLDEVMASDALFNSAVSGLSEIIPIAAAKVEKY